MVDHCIHVWLPCLFFTIHCTRYFLSNISSMRRSVSSPDERLRREMKIRRTAEYFLTNFKVFHLVMKDCVEYLILLLKQNDFRR